MINLIKNELYKIFHKKFIYVMAILMIVLRIFVAVISNIDFSVDFTSMIFEQSVKELENAGSSMSDEEKAYLVSDKNIYDTYKVLKEEGYKTNSWQGYAIVNGAVNANIGCMNESKYLTKDDEKYNSCKEEYEKNLQKIKDGDWEYFVKLDLNEAKEGLEGLTSNEMIPEEEIKNQKDSLERRIKGDEYRLEYKIPFDYSYKSNILYEYAFTNVDLELIEKDESKITKREELVQKRDMEKNYKELVYKVENNKLPASDNTSSTQESLISTFSSASFFFVIFIVVLGATILADEFNKGTIKQLLLKPYTRTQILVSKYISCLIVFFVFVVGCILAYSIIDGIGYGFKDLMSPVVVYNFKTGNIMEMNTYVYILLNFLCSLPHYLILFTIGFLVAVLLENTVVGIIIPLVLDTFAGLIAMLLPQSMEKVVAILPSTCWELGQFLFGGISSNRYSTIWVSLVVDIILVALMIVLSLLVFKKKDIKNQ